MFNDIFLILDSGESVLILLDLISAYDTIDQDIPISRLEQWVGVSASTSKTLCSHQHLFSGGHHQAPFLNPFLLSLYVLPLGAIFHKHSILFHFYADDCQIYFPLKHAGAHSIQPDYLVNIKKLTTFPLWLRVTNRLSPIWE